MGKGKQQKFAEIRRFRNVFQPSFHEVFQADFRLKGKWHCFFENNHPLVLELGCGKGEYTTGLAEACPDVNFIGVDIKGARIWTGARYANDMGLKNVAFIRTRIEFICSFFSKDEVREIWLTFPDPQLKKKRNKKRLTSARFLNLYRQFLEDKGRVHLKTDNRVLYRYTLDLCGHNNIHVTAATDDLYGGEHDFPLSSIQTFYEKQYRDKGLNIHYLSFLLPHQQIEELPEDD